MLVTAAAPATEHTAPDRVARAVAESFPGIEPRHVAASAVPGLYRVVLGGDLVYVTADGRHLLTGKLFDLEARKDLTEPVLARLRLQTLRGVPESRMLVFAPQGETRYTITTFTDIDCPYCRRMHAEIDELNGLGIRVRYLLYPRAGIGSRSYDKAVSVWCAADRNAALTRAKTGRNPPKRSCDNPVQEHMRLADEVGLTGTPMTITESGERIRGYLPPKELLARLRGAGAPHASAPVPDARTP
ncbi:MAG: DsbC family protein [Gammaproteobacteria bacterium]|nr:DsbC family protein [Gammaproteobacteria bacterium]NIR84368.1 DsbC family protein [Gammaproteobacteria bacterium]NIR89884.1 DsbC family protein [Gammaproteobacteria bacterium]NIU05751.1 DsbC family protein [Gammaproteobacteria bacterium]NIV52511.1 thioredoxin fold domain-containing protein [Gammaproteobacteria bacterium]